MDGGSTIGEVAKQTGLSTSAIRYYEAEGIVTASARSDSGYRLYADGDVRRLLLAKQARHLGLSLSEVKELVEGVSTLDCPTFAATLGDRLASQRAAVAARIAELRELEATLVALESHINNCVCRPGMAAADCATTFLEPEKGGGHDCPPCM